MNVTIRLLQLSQVCLRVVSITVVNAIRGIVFHPCKLPTPVNDAPTVSLNAQLSLIQICAREFNSMTGYMQLASMSLRPSISTHVYPYQLLFRALESNCITSQNHWLWSATACTHMCM